MPALCKKRERGKRKETKGIRMSRRGGLVICAWVYTFNLRGSWSGITVCDWQQEVWGAGAMEGESDGALVTGLPSSLFLSLGSGGPGSADAHTDSV